jgi:outer membrane biosynthesis protein TonB
MAQSRRKGRSGAALLVSVAVHLVVLVLLARAIPIMPAIAPGRDEQIELISLPPLTRFATPVTRAASSETASAVEAPQALSEATAPLRRTAPHPRPAQVHPAEKPAPPKPQPAARPTTASARPAPTQPSQAPTQPSAVAGAAPASTPHGGASSAHSAAAANLPGDEPSGGVRKFLRRTVGCSVEDFAHLTVAERAECERQFGVQAAIGAKQKLDVLSPNKRAYYDAVREAYEDAHNAYTPMDTQAGGQGASSSMGGHGLNYSCVHGKCGMNLPSGAGTEELGVGVPPK